MTALAAQRSTGMAAAAALSRRELLRFVRRPSRLIASIGTPALMWVFAAAGFSGSISASAPAGQTYAAFLLPGVITMVILFGTIFAAISLIQDRQAGFLQSVLVSPAPPWAVVASKVFGGALIATVQAAILLLSAPLVGLHPGVIGFLGAIIACALTAIAVIGLGLSAAWWINSTSGFHGVMNMLLVPMWLLSGALFPVDGASRWMAALVRINPLSWCTQALGASLGLATSIRPELAWTGTIAFAASMVALASIVMGRPGRIAPAGGHE